MLDCCISEDDGSGIAPRWPWSAVQQCADDLRCVVLADCTLQGDVIVAAVYGAITKCQCGDAPGSEYRGYAARSRYLVSHGGVADM